MGLFAKVFGGIAKIAKKIASGVKSAAETVVKGCAKLYSSYTGKDKFEEAKRLYENLRQRMELAKQDYSAFIEKTTLEIEGQVNSINAMKKGLNREHFQRFLQIASRIAHWDIVLRDLPDEFRYKALEVEGLKSRENLFLIDFDRNPIKSNLKALFSLGFWSRKEAKETLHQVQEQEKILEYELAKIDAEKTRLNVVHESLGNVVTYFKELTELYGGILDELEYTIHMIDNVRYIHNPIAQDGRVDCYLFPKQHLLCLMAADKMTRILFEMTTLRYLTHTGELIENDHRILADKIQDIEVITSKLAA